ENAGRSVAVDGRTNTDLCSQLQRLAVAQHFDADLVARLGARHLVHRAATVTGWFAVDAEDQVSRLQPGLLRRAVAVNAGDDDARVAFQTEGLRQLRRQRLYLDAQIAADHLAVLDDRAHHLQCQLHRYGETDTLRTAGLGEDRRVDPHQIAMGIDQRTAGVARVDGRIGLDEVLVGVEAQLVAPSGADD